MFSRSERVGEVMLLFCGVLEGFFPIIAHQASRMFPPLLFTGVGSLIAATVLFVVYLLKGQRREAIPLQAFLYAIVVAILIVVAMSVIFVGAGYTSGINVALLGQAEMLFTFFVATLLLGERLRTIPLLGAIIVFIGTVLVLFNGTFAFNKGDVMIVLICISFPFGNIFAKKALDLISSESLLMLRYAIGGCILLALSILIEGVPGNVLQINMHTVAYMVVYSIFVLIGSKLLWYGGLKRLPLGMSVYIASSAPAFGLLFSLLLLREVPTAYQLSGFVLVMVGIYMLFIKPSLQMPVEV